jgi:endonuclease/exonuclease/phosphatase family metal-dependent hydrolase
MSQFQTFSEQQAVELQKFVDAFAGANPVIALGDFNCGPDTDTFDPVDACNCSFSKLLNVISRN